MAHLLANRVGPVGPAVDERQSQSLCEMVRRKHSSVGVMTNQLESAYPRVSDQGRAAVQRYWQAERIPELPAPREREYGYSSLLSKILSAYYLMQVGRAAAGVGSISVYP